MVDHQGVPVNEVRPAEVVAAAMPIWSNGSWLALRAIDALRAAGYSVVRREDAVTHQLKDWIL
jgi:hypothetical protein